MQYIAEEGNITETIYHNPVLNWAEEIRNSDTEGIIEGTGYIDYIYWPEYKNYTLNGNFVSDPYKFVNIKLIEWEGASWRADKNIVMYNMRFIVLFIHSFMDFDNYENPIQKVYDDRFNIFITPSLDIVKVNKLHIRKNYVNLYDDPFSFGLNFGTHEDKKTKTFYSVQDSESDFYEGKYTSTKAIVQLVIDDQEDYYTRNVYTYLDMIGQIGGVFGMLDLFGAFFIAIIADKLFYYSIVSKLYQIHKEEPKGNLDLIDSKAFPTSLKRKNMLVLEETKVSPKPSLKLPEISKSKDKNKSTFSSIQKNYNIVDQVKSIISSRRRLVYHSYEVWFNLISFWLWWKLGKYGIKYRQNIFKKGSQKLNQEMDYISTIESIRQLKIMVKHLLTENQRFMISFHENNLLSLEDDHPLNNSLITPIYDIPYI